jgi:hypothetical protein
MRKSAKFRNFLFDAKDDWIPVTDFRPKKERLERWSSNRNLVTLNVTLRFFSEEERGKCP